MNSVWKFVRPYKVAALFAVFLMITEIIIELLQPMLMVKIVNEGIMKENLEVVVFWGAIMLFFTLLSCGTGILNTYYASHVSQSFGFDVRQKIFRKVQSLSFEQFSLFDSGSLMTRLTNDIQQLQTTLFMLLRIIFKAPIMVVGGIVMAFLVNPSLAMYLAVVVPIVFTVIIFVLNKGSRMFKSVQQKLDNVNNVMGENLTGMKLIRAYTRREFEAQRFHGKNEQLKEKTTSVLRFMEITMPSLLLVMNITILCILWFGSQQIAASTINVGEVVAIVNYATRITSSLSLFTFIVVVLSRSNASASRLNEVLQTPLDMNSDEKQVEDVNIQGEVSFEHVSFKYGNQERWALKDLSFHVKQGETLAILGATGSGKTTLMQLIPRLYDPSSGVVKVDGQDVKMYHPISLRQNIGIVPQEAFLFSGSIKDNLLWGKRDATDEELKDACEKAQIFRMISEYKSGMETIIGQKGVNLSGGQRQRLSIARALVRKPAILLLDDSTSALDLETEQKLLQELKNETCTKIVVTQKISTALYADHIILLEDGEKVAEGAHEYLSNHSPLYQEILASQVGKGSDHHVMETIL